jgi:hypothetical protein
MALLNLLQKVIKDGTATKWNSQSRFIFECNQVMQYSTV